ncbi:MAG: glycosyltransferase [Pseudomonadota bacterium]
MANAEASCFVVVAPGPRRELDGTLVAAAAAFQAQEGEGAELVLLDPDRRLPRSLLSELGKMTRIGAPPGHLAADPEIGTPYLWLTRASRVLDLWLRQARPARVVAVDLTGALFYGTAAKRHGLAHQQTDLEVLRFGPLEELLASHFLFPSDVDLAAAHMARESLDGADRIWWPTLAPDGSDEAMTDKGLDLVVLLGSRDAIAAGWSARVAKALADERPGLRLVLARLGRKPNAEQWQEAATQLADSGIALSAESLRPGQPTTKRSAPAFGFLPGAGADSAILAGQLGLPLAIKAPAARDAEASPWSVAPAPQKAAAMIAKGLAEGPPKARLGFEAEAPARDAAPTKSELPSITICLVHFNRPAMLARAIESLERQSYGGPLETIIVDDGSTSEEAQAALDRLEAELAPTRWRILRKSNGYPGAARNAAAAQARGDYLLFMDDDNLAKPHMVATLASAAQTGGADIVTCLNDAFNRQDGAGQPVAYGERLFLGNALALGPLANVFGDVNALIRRETFDALGGFTEDYAVGCEDWEFFLRAALAGADLRVIPESLFHYRVAPGSITDTTGMARNVSRVARALLARDGLAPLAAFAQQGLLKLPSGEEE